MCCVHCSVCTDLRMSQHSPLLCEGTNFSVPYIQRPFCHAYNLLLLPCAMPVPKEEMALSFLPSFLPLLSGRRLSVDPAIQGLKNPPPFFPSLLSPPRKDEYNLSPYIRSSTTPYFTPFFLPIPLLHEIKSQAMEGISKI